MCFCFNESTGKVKPPNCLKLANVTPVFKNDAGTSKDNYRPVSILPKFSKIFEKLLQKQLLVFFDIICQSFYSVSQKGMARKAPY